MSSPLAMRPDARRRIAAILAIAIALASCASGPAQRAAGSGTTATPASRRAQLRELQRRVEELSQKVESQNQLILQLQQQLARDIPQSGSATATPSAAAPAVPPASPAPVVAARPPSAPTSASGPGYWPNGLTIGALLDGYYEYNFNSPVGRVNDLRAYDVSSDSFTLSQADLLIERAPDLGQGRNWGLRLDLQFGQATSTLQANAANEPHPEVYRNIWQAYGSYVFPVADSLTVDFGKWASSLGSEGNYSQDQLNYSRSLWYDYLPFYHMGLRARLQVNDQLAVQLWVVNGVDQTEDFNSGKDVMLGFVLAPLPTLTWTGNYYQGNEHPDVVYVSGAPPAEAIVPYQEGSYVFPIETPPTGKLQIATSYLTWQATRALRLAAEADYVQERLYSGSSPQGMHGGALYARYQLSRALALALRAEYLADVDGLFTGLPQNLEEATLTLDYRLAEGFLLRGELRRDQSNRHYFLGPTIGVVEPQQSTLTLGVVWWFGKSGPW